MGVYVLAGASMAAPAMCLASKTGSLFCFEIVLASFVVAEFSVGLFMPFAGTLRSKYVPDAYQGAILNIFRLPLNAVVVGGTYATDVLATSTVFTLVSIFLLSASFLQ